MNNINSLIVEGNITNPSKNRAFTMAVNHYYKNADGKFQTETSYFDVETFGKLADLCDKYAVNGRGVSVVGRLTQKVWKEEGKNFAKVYVVAEHIEFKPMKKED